MMSSRKEYARRFVESAEAIWRKDLIQPSVDGIEKIGEAVWDVDNLEAEPVEKPRKAASKREGM
jgi:hypothetical protein